MRCVKLVASKSDGAVCVFAIDVERKKTRKRRGKVGSGEGGGEEGET